MNTYKFLISLSIAAILVSLSGCNLKEQYVRLDPNIEVQKTEFAKPVLVTLIIEDNRSNKTLGQVGDPNKKMYNVYLGDDVSSGLFGNVAGALKDIGFDVASVSTEDSRLLTISLTELTLTSTKQPLNFWTDLNTEIQIIAKNGLKTYTRDLSISTNSITPGPAFIDISTRMVNEAMAALLSQALAPKSKLIGFLLEEN